MQVKLVVVDLELSRRSKRWLLGGGVLCLAILAGGAVAYSSGLVTWTSGQTLKAADLNASFAALQTPPGTVVAFAGPVVPGGWLLCDGTAVSRTTYANLFSAIGTVSGSGDGASTFNLPDYRGRFLRGVDGGAMRDPDRATRTAAANGGNVGDVVGSVQPDSFQGWMPQIRTRVGLTAASLAADADYVLYSASAMSGVAPSPIFRADTYGFLPFASYGTPRVSSETRPQNVDVSYVIKY
jgi:phage-related tail fiber protein